MSLYLERLLFKSPTSVHLSQVHKNDFDDSTGKKKHFKYETRNFWIKKLS